METKEAKKLIHDTYIKVFKRTPLRQRLDDILKEAIELNRFTDLRSLKDETADLLGSLIQLTNECDWELDDLIFDNIDKIKNRQLQYASMGRKINVAIYGGAFDPITEGHIQVAKVVLDSSKIFDEVWLMPCNQHLYNKKMESPEHRIKMCELATKIDGRIKISSFEIKNQLRGETYHIVKCLQETDMADKEYSFSMIIGMDNANTFDKWTNYTELEKLIPFVVVPRSGVDRDPKVTWYLKQPHIYLEPEQPLMMISSSQVRNVIKNTSKGTLDWQCLENALHPDVLDYIEKNQLYMEDKNA